MTVISLGKNISSLKAQRQLNDISASLSRTYERLASGMRINHASDDAAGLAISSKLNAHARVYGQALRNANDGISALNIAEGAVTQLSDILIRIKELAESAGNGTLALTQRRSLNAEAKALTEEYNRILSSTKFNRNKLIDGSLTELGIQLGFGSDGRLSFGVGGGLERTVGTGNFGTGGSTLGLALDTGTADLNEDGFDDLILADAIGGTQIRLSNGDGTFAAAQSLGVSSSLQVLAGDLNGDGHVDIVSGTGDSMKVSLGVGDGTFAAATSYAMAGGSGLAPAFGDLNGDGALDIVLGNGSSIRTFINRGDGSFDAGVTVASSSNQFLGNLHVADFNSDGSADVLFTNYTSETAYLTGNGDGTFGASHSFGTGYDSWWTTVGDFNQDGHVDLIVTAATFSGAWIPWGGPKVFMNNGDGTFSEGQQMTESPSGNGVLVGDFNRDGILDLMGQNGTNLVSWLGNGDGSFGAAIVSAARQTDLRAASFGDVNGDGSPDLIDSAGGASAYLHLGDSTQVSTVQRFNLTTREEALSTLDLLDDYIARVSKELGNIGSAQSRLQSAVNTISQTRENYYAAYSRIVDVDVADETSKLLVNQIRQQAAASIMAQANQTPALALVLLGR